MKTRTLLIVISSAILIGALSIPHAMGMGGAGGMGSGGMGGGMDISGVPTQTADSGSSASGMGRHMDMGPHMKMTDQRPLTPADAQRAQVIIQDHARRAFEVSGLQIG